MPNTPALVGLGASAYVPWRQVYSNLPSAQGIDHVTSKYRGTWLERRGTTVSKLLHLQKSAYILLKRS